MFSARMNHPLEGTSSLNASIHLVNLVRGRNGLMAAFYLYFQVCLAYMTSAVMTKRGDSFKVRGDPTL